MKVNETPIKIYLNPDAVPHNQSGKFLFIHNSDIDESKCIIEYIRKDAFIKKTCKWLQKEVVEDYTGVVWENLIEDFKNYMKGE